MPNPKAMIASSHVESAGKFEGSRANVMVGPCFFLCACTHMPFSTVFSYRIVLVFFPAVLFSSFLHRQPNGTRGFRNPKEKEKGKGKNKGGKGDLNGKGKGTRERDAEFWGLISGTITRLVELVHLLPNPSIGIQIQISTVLLPICALSSPSAKIAEPDS